MQIINELIKEHKSYGSQLAETVKQTIEMKYGTSTRKTLITVIDDDGMIDCYTKLKPAFDSRGIVGCSAVFTNGVSTGTAMTVAQLKELHNSGWEIMSHTASHVNLTTLTEEQIREQLKKSSEAIKNWVGEIDGIVYPFGAINETVKSIAKEYFNYGFAQYGLSTLPLDSYCIQREVVGEDDTKTLEHFKSIVDKAIAEKRWLVFNIHIRTSSDKQFNNMLGAIDYAKSLGVEVVTAREAIKYFGNSIEKRNENNYTVIANDGKLYTNSDNIIDVPIVVTEINKFKASDLLGVYPLGMTITPISNANTEISSFPEGKYGTLTTCKTNSVVANSGFSYQEYQVFGNANKYRRGCNSDGTWKSWVRIYNISATDFTRTISSQNVPANSGISIAITSMTGVTQDDMFIATPKAFISTGLMWNIYTTTNGAIALRIVNVTNGDILLPEVTWNIKSMKI